jgi:hypothetical protein
MTKILELPEIDTDIDDDETEEKYTSFSRWNTSFVDKEGGHGHSYTNKVKSFFDKVQDAHEEVRKAIGGIRLTCSIETPKPEDDVQIDVKGPEKTIENILSHLPNYLRDSNLTKEDLYSPTLPDGIKTTKHILKYASKKLDDYNNLLYGAPYVCMESVSKHVAQLGSDYTAKNPTGTTYGVVLTTAARAFLSIGHFGPDNGSCFGQGRQNYNHKFHIGVSPDTFVLLIKKKLGKLHEATNSPDTVARMWGFYSKNKISFCNYYSKGSITRADAFYIAKCLSCAIFDTTYEDIGFVEDKILICGDHVYHNKNKAENWTFYTTAKAPEVHELNSRIL